MVPITERQRVERKKSLGASDMGDLFNIQPYGSTIDLWMEKVFDVDRPTSKPAEAGNWLETGVLDYVEHRYGKGRRNQRRAAPNGLPLKANCDFIIGASGRPVDAKTAGLFWFTSDDWGEDGTDQVPDAHNLQSHAQMLCTGADVGYIVAFLGGRGFVCYEIERNESIINAIIERTKSFWVDHVLAQIMPPGAPPSMEVLRHMRREPDVTVNLDHGAVKIADRLKIQQKLCTASDKRKKALSAALLATLGDADGGRLPDGRLVTYFIEHRKAVAACSFPKMYVRKG